MRLMKFPTFHGKKLSIIAAAVVVSCVSGLLLYMSLQEAPPRLSAQYPLGPTPPPVSYDSSIFPVSKTTESDNMQGVLPDNPVETPEPEDVDHLSDPSPDALTKTSEPLGNPFERDVVMGHLLGDPDAPVTITEFADFL